MKWNFLMSQTQIEEDQDPVACQDEDDGGNECLDDMVRHWAGL